MLLNKKWCDTSKIITNYNGFTPQTFYYDNSQPTFTLVKIRFSN